MSELGQPVVANAADQIRRLLTTHPVYRRQWQQYARRMRQFEISYAGVAQVVALYLWDQGLRPENQMDLPRQLRHRISRALQGEKLTAETVTWITEAFSFETGDAHVVWQAFFENGTTASTSTPCSYCNAGGGSVR